MKETKRTFSVPEKFFDRLVEHYVTSHAYEVLGYAEDKTQASLEEIRQQVHSDPDGKEYIHLHGCLAAFVRVYLDDYSSSEHEIKSTTEYLSVWEAAVQISEQMVYNSIPDGNLKTLVDNMNELGIR